MEEEKKDHKKKRIPWFDQNKSHRKSLANYLNQAILEKYPHTDSAILLRKKNILKNMCCDEEAYSLSDVCIALIKLISKKQISKLSSKYCPVKLVFSVKKNT